MRFANTFSFSSIVNKSASVITIILDCFVCIKFMIFYQGGRVLSKRGKFTSIDLYKAKLIFLMSKRRNWIEDSVLIVHPN